jgi:hypothetical protein
MTDLFSQKLDRLNPAVQAILLSDYGKQMEREIVNHFSLQGKLSLIGSIVTELYLGDIKLAKLSEELRARLGVDDAIARKLVCEIVGRRLLPIKQFFREKYGEDAESVIAANGGNPSSYYGYTSQYSAAIKKEESSQKEILESDEKIVITEQNMTGIDVKFDEQLEITDSVAVFEGSLLPLLEYNSGSLLREYNLVLLQLLGEVKDFKSKLERALYQNVEIISEKSFMLDGQEKESSIKNWLLDFIEKKGSGMFTNIELTKFISESENAKGLNEEEKMVVSRLLTVYRNLKFFPECFSGTPLEQWEIIPTQKEEAATPEAKISHDKSSGREAIIKELKGNIDNYAPGSLEREILEEESEKDREHHKLILLRNKYAEGSLERRAVEEEIRKIEK